MLNQQLTESIVQRLSEVYHPTNIYLFGSYAWGHPTDQSDVDLLVVVPESTEKAWVRPRKGIRAMRGLPISEDIIVLTQAEFQASATQKMSLFYKIFNEGKIIYGE